VLWRFAGEQKHVTESLSVQKNDFLFYFCYGEGGSGYLIVMVEPAVYTGIGAFTGYINRGEHLDGPPETLNRQPMGRLGHFFQKTGRGRREQRQ
jgi:hypothetical protein